MWRNLPVRAPRRPSISGRAFQKGGWGAGRHKRQSVPTQSPAQQPPAAVGAFSAANSLDTSAAGAAGASSMPAANGSDAPAVDVLDASAADAAGAPGAASASEVPAVSEVSDASTGTANANCLSTGSPV